MQDKLITFKAFFNFKLEKSFHVTLISDNPGQMNLQIYFPFSSCIYELMQHDSICHVKAPKWLLDKKEITNLIVEV